MGASLLIRFMSDVAAFFEKRSCWSGVFSARMFFITCYMRVDSINGDTPSSNRVSALDSCFLRGLGMATIRWHGPTTPFQSRRHILFATHPPQLAQEPRGPAPCQIAVPYFAPTSSEEKRTACQNQHPTTQMRAVKSEHGGALLCRSQHPPPHTQM